jgi:hypothetical protein
MLGETCVPVAAEPLEDAAVFGTMVACLDPVGAATWLEADACEPAETRAA